MKLAYYNEIDPFAAAWLRELIKAGLIADGEVDERSIADVRPDDLRGFRQCHFFAGIGGWSLALRLAGWDDTRPVWTGSCPCQPFSAAGSAHGAADSRHVWPTWFKLVEDCGPHVVFGEQVSSIDGLAWFDLVSTDLESADYALGSLDACGACIGCPTIGQRLWFVAEAKSVQFDGAAQRRERAGEVSAAGSDSGASIRRSRGARRLAAADFVIAGDGSLQPSGGYVQPPRNATAGFWADAEWIYCRDERWRPVEPGTFPLAPGIPGRLGRLRGYGNSIVPELGATFIEAYMTR